MIINIDETRVVEVAQYANRLNQVKEHSCKACSAEYKNMLYSFRKMIKHPEDEVLICTEENKILGVLALFVEAENKYLEAVGGVYAEENYQEVAMEFYGYMKEKYAGFHFDAVYPIENKEAMKFMQSIGASSSGIDLEMKLKKDNFHHLELSKQALPLSKKYYEEFCRFHNNNSPNVQWTGDRLLKALDRFNIYIALDNDELVGTIVSSAYEKSKSEIYFLEIDKHHQRQGYAKSLMEKSIHEAFLSGIEEVLVIVNNNDIPSINLHNSFGFEKADATSTYSIEVL